MKTYRCLLFLLLICFQTNGQTSKTDSLKNMLDNISKQNTEEYLTRLHVYGEALLEISIDSAIQMGEKGLKLANDAQLTKHQISFHSLLASSFGREGNFKQAIEHNKILVDFYQSPGKEDILIETYITIGSYYTRLNPEQAIPYYNKALQALKGMDKPKILANLHQNMGIAFYYQKKMREAGIHIQQAIEAFTKVKDWESLSSNYNILGLIRQEEMRLDEAENHFVKAMDLAEKHQLHYSKIGILANQGRLFAAKGQAEKGIIFIQKAYEEAINARYKHRATTILTSLSAAYYELGNIRKAITVLAESLALQETLHDTQMKLLTLDEISAMYAEVGNFENAYTTLSQLKTLQDSLSIDKNQQSIAELEKKYKTQEQEVKIQLQEVSLQQQANKLLITSLFSLLLIGFIFFMWRNNQQRKRINTQLRQLDRAKSRFFANLSHELRTPLTLILAPIENAITKVKSKSAKEDLQLAHSNSKKLLTLVNEVLDLSKLESGKMQLKENAVSLEKLLRRIFFSYHSLAQLRGFILSFSYHLSEDLVVNLDVSKFEKVINNLLSNAFKYSHTGGVITLRVGKENEDIKIEVSDTGKGIPAEELQKIFDRFYQAAGENEPLQGGTGIGLAYAKEIARLFGGQLRVESEVGEGSTFIFTMPLKKSYEKPMAIEKTEVVQKVDTTTLPLAVTKPQILIVEDNPEMSQFLVQSLATHFHCITAMDGEKALQLLRKGLKIDLITSDVMMPNMDGFTFLEKVHEMESFQKIPFILLTARAMEEDKLRGLSLGVNDYLTKPFSTKELIARIQNLLKNKRTREEISLEDEDNSANELNYEEKLLKKAENFVIAHLSDGTYRVSDFAKDMAYSPRQLERILKKQTGLSPVEFIREIRLQKAYTLLQKKQFATVAEVRYAVGMENASYFTKKFQERFGKTPSEIG